MACFNTKAGVRLVGDIICSGRCLILSSTCTYGANEINFGFDYTGATRKIAGTGNCKIAIGYGAGYANSGAAQIAIGDLALRSNTGSCNVAIGRYSMIGSGAGSNNTGVGQSALQCLTSGSRNVAVGNFALNSLTTGSDNIAIGNGSGPGITTTSASVAIGADARANCSSGNRATAIGFCAIAATYGSVAVGACSFASGTDVIVIGTGTYRADNGVIWGNSTNSVFNCVYSAWSYISDARDKADIENLDGNLGINFIRKLRPVKYKSDIRKNYVIKCGFEFGEKDGTLANKKESYGFIAQEVKKAAEDLNVNLELVNYNKDNDNYALRYSDLIAPIVETIKQIDGRIQEIKNKLGMI